MLDRSSSRAWIARAGVLIAGSSGVTWSTRRQSSHTEAPGVTMMPAWVVSPEFIAASTTPRMVGSLMPYGSVSTKLYSRLMHQRPNRLSMHKRSTNRYHGVAQPSYHSVGAY